MLTDILLAVLGFCVVVLFAGIIVLKKKLDDTSDRIIKLAVKITEIDDLATRVDETTGAELYRLRQEFNAFMTNYGEASIEEMKESAKAQKAWADGLNSIMQFGANLHGRGDST